MKIMISAIAFALLIFGAASGQQTAKQEGRVDDESVQEMNRKIQTLEQKMTAMQKRIDALESRTYSRLPAGVQNQMPPGARSFQFNGMQVFQLPVAPDKNQDSMKKK